MNDSVQSVTRHSNLHKCLAVFLSLLMVMSCFGGFSFTANAAEVVANGTFSGYTTTWSLDSDGVLTIGGTGTTPSYSSATSTPYYEYKDNIHRILIQDGVTSIGNYLLSSLDSVEGDIIIPDTVTKIGNFSFKSCTANGTLTLSNNLQTIGQQAFASCKNLTGDVKIPSSVQTISWNIFQGDSSLRGQLIFEEPSSLKSIPDNAFNSTRFTGILKIPDSVTRIGKQAFQAITASEIYIGSSVQSIGQQAFMNCKLAQNDLILPDSLISIAVNAFTGTGFSSVHFGNSITTIGESAFSESKIGGELIFPDSLTSIGDYAFIRCENLTGELTIPSTVTSVGKCAFHGCAAQTDIVKFFKNYPEMIRVELQTNSAWTYPPTVNQDGRNWFFVYCTDSSHTTESKVADIIVDVPYIFVSSVSTTDEADSEEIISINPNTTATTQITVTDIQPEDATNKTITFTSSNPSVATVDQTGLVTAVSAGTATITLTADEGHTILKTFTINTQNSNVGVTGISVTPNPVALDIGNTQQLALTFTPADATNQSVSYSSSNPDVATVSETGLVTAVGEGTATITVTANDGSGVTTTVPVTVTDPSIIARGQCGDTAYWKITQDGDDKVFTVYGTGDMWNREHWTGDAFDAWDVTKIVIEEGITSICGKAFGSFSVTAKSQGREYPEQTSFGGYKESESDLVSTKIFQNASGNLILPNSVISIGSEAFARCSNLSGTLVLGNNVQTIMREAFLGCTGFTGSLTIPNSVVSIGDSAFSDCTGLDGSLVLGSSVQTVGSYVFRDCRNLTGILEIPASVTSIGKEAFHGTASYTNGSSVYNGNLEDSNTYKFFEHYRGDSPDDAYQFVEVVEGERIEPTPTQNGTQVYKIYCRDAYHNGEHNDESFYGYQKNLVTTINEPVEYIPVSNIAVTPSEVAINIGETKLLSVTITPDNATNPAVTYTSSNTTIATIDENGLVTGVAGGTATITITTVDGTGTPIVIPVTVITPHTHTPGEPVHENDVRDDDNGTYTFELNTYCQDDNTLLGTEVVILDRTPAVEAVVGTDGHNEYFTDDKGTDDTSDDVIYVWNATEEKYELGAIVPTHVHNPGESVHENDVRDDDNGTYTFELNTYCQDDGELVNSETVTLTIVPEVPAQPGTDGNIEYFIDNKGTDDPTDDDIYVWDDDADKYVPFNGDLTTHVHNPGEPRHENDVRDDNAGTYTFELNTYCESEDPEVLLDSELVTLTLVPAVDAEPGTDGNIEYFVDDKGTDDTSDDDIYVWDDDADKYVPFDGDLTTHVHNPGEPVHENDVRDDDNGTYTFELNTYCQDDNELVDSKTVTLIIVPEVPAQPGTDGNIEYFVDDKGTDDTSDDDIYVWDDDADKYVPFDGDVTTHVHNPGEPVHENDVRDDDNGTYTFELNTYCQDDGELVNSETVTLTIVPEVPAQPGADGNIEYFVDDKGTDDPTDDDIYVWDDDADKYVPFDGDVTTHVHNPGEPRHENDVRDDVAGTYTFELNTYCQDDGELVNSETVTLTIVPEVPAQPGTDGNIEYFVDDKGTDDTSDDDIYVWDDNADKYVPFDGDVTTHEHNPGTPAQENANPDTTDPGFDMVTRCEEDGEILNSEHVDLTYVPEKAPDDTADGYEAYYIDDNGNVYDYNEDSELFVPSEIHYIHNPGEPVHENDKHNDATGEYIFDLATYCTNDGTELDRETIVLTKHDAKAPSQDSDGNIEYYEDENGNKYLWNEDEGKYVPTDDTSIIVPRTPVTSLIATADRTDLDMDGIQTAKITVEINPSDASDKRVTYVSSNPSVVLVDNNGRILAVGGGTATVTVSSKSNPEVKDTITFNVVQDTYRLDGPNSGNIGETGTISMYTDTAKPYYVKYFTSNNSLLEIDENTGAYAVRGAGNATITARIYFGDGTTKDVTKSFRCVDPDAGKYRCKMCDTYEAMKDAPIVGIFYTIVHFFVHLAHSIGYAT